MFPPLNYRNRRRIHFLHRWRLPLHPEQPKVDLLNSKSTWTLKTKIARAIWKPFQVVLFSQGPRFLSPLRIASLRLFGARIGKKVLIMSGVKVWCPWNLEIGDCSAIGFDVEIYNFAPVIIGEQTVVSQYSFLCTASHDYEVPDMRLFWKPITIGPQCWVAAGAFIAPGITIGEGAIVGARSVVTRNVAAWTVVAGNPARYIKNRHICQSKSQSD